MKTGKQRRKIAEYISFQMEKVSHGGESWMICIPRKIRR